MPLAKIMKGDFCMKNHDNKDVYEDKNETLEETIGIVVNCQRLNIRKEPSVNSRVIGLAEVSDELKIDMDNSTDEWYAVITTDGTEGFCMKMFIKLRQ